MTELIKLHDKEGSYSKGNCWFLDHSKFLGNFTPKDSVSNTENQNWSFTIYSSKHVRSLYMYSKTRSSAVIEAYEKDLPLIEICSGDYEHPLYIVAKPNVDIDGLKQKWLSNYWFQHLMLFKKNNHGINEPISIYGDDL